MAPDAISAHDVSVKISRPFRAEHRRRAVRRLAFGFSGPPCFVCCPYQTEEKADVEHHFATACLRRQPLWWGQAALPQEMDRPTYEAFLLFMWWPVLLDSINLTFVQLVFLPITGLGAGSGQPLPTKHNDHCWQGHQ